MRGRWEVHYDPYDLSRVWVRDQAGGGWITVPWTQLPMVAAPFADFTWRYARQVLAGSGGDDTDQAAVAARAGLLHRAKHGPPDRVIARTSAAAASSQLPELPGTGENGTPDRAAGQDVTADAGIEPFGVFDPLAQEKGLW